MAQLTFDKYTITGTAQELANYVFEYEVRAAGTKAQWTQTASNSVTTNSTSDNPSGM